MSAPPWAPPEEYPEQQRGDAWEPLHPPGTNGETPKRRTTAADVATIDDLMRAGSEVRWLWPGWIPIGVLTALAGEGGKGKTRFCADLMRRQRHGMPWPDGTPMQAPRDGLWLWVLADNHHDEIVGLAQAFDIAPNFRLNAHRSDPYGGVTLESKEDIDALEGRINAVKPIAVVIDTVGNATDRNLSKQEDAKAFYAPLQVIARMHSCALMCLTHLNASGTFLGRRVQEKVRVALRMMHPEGQDRRRIEVFKTNAKKPAPLGLTMNDGGNDYDDRPPEMTADEPGQKPGRPNVKTKECEEWLRERLGRGACRVSVIRNDAELTKGFSAKVLYASMRLLDVEEYEADDGRKWWRLPADVGETNGNPYA